MDINVRLQKHDAEDPVDLQLRHEYQVAIGMLMWAAIATRPDITFAVQHLSQFSQHPAQEHFTAVKRVFRYLKGTIDIGLNYSGTAFDREKIFRVFSDADWGNSPDDRRSISGYENHKTIGEWLFEDIICRWGGLREIVTDNGPAFIKAVAYLAKKYHINFIRISGYNSRANGLVERPHFDVRQALFKAVDGVERRWFMGAYSVFWSERVTIRKRMGCSPYYAATGTHPLLPFDITEATYLQPPPDSVLSSTDLIARRAVALQKRSEDLTKLHSDVYAARKKAALRFELQHAQTIRNFDFKPGSLVLMRNTKIEKSLNRKMRPRYIGPLIVVSRNKGGAYIICELDGSVLHRPVAAFRLLPYFARRSIPFPITAIDIDTNRLRELEETNLLDDDSFPDISAGDEPGPGLDSGESDSD
ncbi:putative integrase core domain containing protein [Lyophyllum shimeji]|uniref:Integrase core domain containing protein n=1 Tax=Lyophyllum shimeji TaxID=47721 RepID=A0A9P3PZL3_LYOSH|nr:putative integrase core domain containing protein [Lyophyllum shimeji]